MALPLRTVKDNEFESLLPSTSRDFLTFSDVPSLTSSTVFNQISCKESSESSRSESNNEIKMFSSDTLIREEDTTIFLVSKEEITKNKKTEVTSRLSSHSSSNQDASTEEEVSRLREVNSNSSRKEITQKNTACSNTSSNINSNTSSSSRLNSGSLNKKPLGIELPSLFLLSLESVAINIKYVQSLEGIPEDIVMMLFWGIIRLGGMTERVLHLFLATRHNAVKESVKRLGLQARSRPVLPTRCCDKF